MRSARDAAGKAVLVHTGRDRHWRTDAYFDGHPTTPALTWPYRTEGVLMLVPDGEVSVAGWRWLVSERRLACACGGMSAGGGA